MNQTVLDIHYRLRTELPQIIQKYFPRTDNVLDLFDHIFKQIFQEKVFVAGKIKTLEFAGLETYQFLDNPQSAALEIRETIPEDETYRVQIAESREKSLSELTVISQKFLIPYRGFGILTVIGPVDLDYRRTVSLITIISRILAIKLGDFTAISIAITMKFIKLIRLSALTSLSRNCFIKIKRKEVLPCRKKRLKKKSRKKERLSKSRKKRKLPKQQLKKRLQTKSCRKRLSEQKILKINTCVLMLKCKMFSAVPMKSVRACKGIAHRTWQRKFSRVLIT